MPALSFNMCMTTGHGKYKPTNVPATLQSKFFISGQPALLQGDKANYHGHSPVGECIATTSKFFIGGIPIIRIGDPLTDGDYIAQGSPKFFIN